MKLVTFEHAGKRSLAALVTLDGAEKVFDLATLDPHLPADMIAFLAAGPPALDRAKKALAAASPSAGLDRSSVTLLAPAAAPGQDYCDRPELPGTCP